MRATVMYAAGDVRIEDVPDPVIEEPTDAILGRHEDRIALAREFGATDVVRERGPEAVERVRELTDGEGAHSVLECVGYEQAVETAIGAP
jgi:threonine dehydrogenase-like Zn-dependent dehydrogenase